MARVMHILATASAGGAEVYVRDLAKGMRKYGVESTVAVLGRSTTVCRSSSFEAAFIGDLKNNGVDVFVVNESSRRRFLSDRTRLLKEARNRGIDIIHSHLITGVALVAMAGYTIVYTHHNEKARIPGMAFRMLNTVVSGYVGISEVCSVVLERLTGREVLTIRNGVDASRFKDVRQRTDDDSRPLRLVAVGAISRQKNYPLMLKALSQLPTKILDRVTLRICGEGMPGDVESVKRLCQELGLADRVQFLGLCMDVPAVLADSDVFLMSSSWEGLPIALIEASMAGLPVVVTDVGGCREVVKACSNGFLVRPESPVDFAQAVQCMVSDVERRAQFSRSAIEGRSQFSIDEACRSHALFYSRFCE